MELTIHKAEPVHPDQGVPSATITIDAQQPTGTTASDAREVFRRDAQALATVLWSTLPGATLDELLGALMARRAVLLRVSMPEAGR